VDRSLQEHRARIAAAEVAFRAPARTARKAEHSLLPVRRHGDSDPVRRWQGRQVLSRSINEFFVSWILVDDCRKVLGPAISADALSDLPLAQVDLDFLQTSLHGFLHEKLGSGYVRDMMKAVERPGFPTGDEERST